MRALGRVFEPDLPPYMRPEGSPGAAKIIDVVPKLKAPAAIVKGPAYIHPVVLALETSLNADSLRTLCTVLRGAGGTVWPAVDNPDQSKKPIMDSGLTIRALLRYTELRHSETDDLTPADFRGKMGEGVRVLLRRCRAYDKEIIQLMEDRGGEVIRLIRAFYDQDYLIGKNMHFFRRLVHVATPSILKCEHEPLPRLLSFLEPYDEIQLEFLYRAATGGDIRYRLSEFEPRLSVLDTISVWLNRAQTGELSIINANKVRTIVLKAIAWDLEMSQDLRLEWIAAAVWASMPHEATENQKVLHGQVRRGVWPIDDPQELFHLTMRLVTEEIVSEGLFKMLGSMMLAGFQASSHELTVQILGEIRPQFMTYPVVLEIVLADITKAFISEAASGEDVEALTTRWSRTGMAITRLKEAVLVSVGMREFGAKFVPGCVARSVRLLLGMGALPGQVQPLVKRLLLLPALRLDEERAPDAAASSTGSAIPTVRELDVAMSDDDLDARTSGDFDGALDLLGRLWAPAGDPVQLVSDADRIFRLVGCADEGPPLEIHRAAERLAQGLAAQLSGQQEAALSTIAAWREEPGSTCLAESLAPLILREAAAGSSFTGEGETEIERSVIVLGRAMRGEPLDLPSVERGLSPFLGAGKSNLEVVYSTMAGACVAGGAPEGILERACGRWLGNGRRTGCLGADVVDAAVASWQLKKTRAEGVAVLRSALRWLTEEALRLCGSKDVEVDDAAAVVTAFQLACKTLPPASGQRKTILAIQGLGVLLSILEGKAPALTDLRQTRDRFCESIGPAGEAALADATAFAWATEIPGIAAPMVASHFGLWWRRLEDDRTMVAALVGGLIDDLHEMHIARAEATWPGNAPMASQTPSWRLEGRARVPWFVPPDVVEAAYSDDGEERRKKAKRALPFSATAKAKALRNTDGRCMYCGSKESLRAILAFPEELGGSQLESNMAACCNICFDFSQRLGGKRWNDALSAKPEKAAEVWWKAQKIANVTGYANLGKR